MALLGLRNGSLNGIDVRCAASAFNLLVSKCTGFPICGLESINNNVAGSQVLISAFSDYLGIWDFRYMKRELLKLREHVNSHRLIKPSIVSTKEGVIVCSSGSDGYLRIWDMKGSLIFEEVKI
jgi:hypothetical protein